MTFSEILQEYVITFGWAITGVVSMSIALPILIWVFDKFTPINEWEEIKRGNLGVAIIVSSLIIAFAIVIGLTVSP